jgi:uncharacterized lipoprotein YajG
VDTEMTRRLTLIAALLLAGCATTSSTITEGPAQPGSTEAATTTSRYEVEAGRDAALVAEMRAAPAPQMPEMQAGQNRSGGGGGVGRQG